MITDELLKQVLQNQICIMMGLSMIQRDDQARQMLLNQITHNEAICEFLDGKFNARRP